MGEINVSEWGKKEYLGSLVREGYGSLEKAKRS